MAEIIIKSGGAFTSVQDLGRYGFQKIGMPAAGVMDNYAARCANLLVNNSEDAAVLEATLLGPEIEFNSPATVAVTGAQMEPEINGIAIKPWRSYFVNIGDILKLKAAKEGVRSYIGISGGINVELIMGSRSTYIKGAIGGFYGRQLKAGDRISLMETSNFSINQLPQSYVPAYESKLNIRAVLGPHEEYFTDEGIAEFFSKIFVTGARSDRMGIFLEGLSIKLSGENTDILSSAILMGSIQVSSNGTPIILMADRQTTGGYAQIATVISADLWKLAQAKPGTEVCFQKVNVKESSVIYKEYEKKLEAVKQICAYGENVKSVNYLELTINGETIKTIIEEKY